MHWTGQIANLEHHGIQEEIDVVIAQRLMVELLDRVVEFAGDVADGLCGVGLAQDRFQHLADLASRDAAQESQQNEVVEIVARVKSKPGVREREITVGADKAYQVQGFIAGLRKLGVVPHVAEYQRSVPEWPNCLTPSERNHFGFAISQANRKRIEKSFGWIKFIAGLRKTKFRGLRRVNWGFCLAAAAMNLIRMAKLMPQTA